MDPGDSLGDLSAIMGDDYSHGFDVDEGDPNVKPNRPPAPEEGEEKDPTIVYLKFKPHRQFLTKLMVQCMPLKKVPKGVDDPFASFATTTSGGGKQISVEDPANAKLAVFPDLQSGSEYVFRLVVTNPAGTMIGKSSGKILTMPNKPPTLESSHTHRFDSIELLFPAQGQFLTEMKVHASLYRPDTVPWKEGTYGVFAVGHPTTCRSVVVNRLRSGTKYIFRLETTNAAGRSLSDTSEPILTLPSPPPAPEEEVKLRSDKQMSLKWSPLGQYVTKLILQYAIMNGKQTFVKMEGGKSVPLEGPRKACGYVCKDLQADKNYVFRLKATNDAGESIGEIGGPVKTVEYAPDQHDKSGYLYLLPKRDGKKTLGRRLSLKKKKPIRYWYVLDGKLLSWYNDAGEDQDEVGFLHLGKVKSLESEFKSNTGLLKLHHKDGKTFTEIMVESADPNLSSETLCGHWTTAIQGAITGETTAVSEEVAAIETPPIKRKGPPPSHAPGEDPNAAKDEEEEEFEEEFDFGMDEGEEMMGFGEDEDALGFGDDDADGEESFGF